MERRRNKINKLPTLQGALVHKHSREHPLEKQRRENEVRPGNRLKGRVQSDGGSIWLWAVGIIISACVWDTPGHSSGFPSANHDALRRRGEVPQTWRHRDQSKAEPPQASCLKRCNYSKPTLCDRNLCCDICLPVCQPGRCNMTRTAMMSMSVYPHQRRPSLAFVPERIGWKGMISSANRRNHYSRIKQPFVYSVDFKQQIKKTFRETTLKGLLQSNYKLDITAG